MLKLVKLLFVFFSQKFSTTQAAWSAVEREAYAVIASLKKCHHIVFGSEFVVFSDHSPLSFLVELTKRSSKLTRWSLALQQYNIVVKYAKACNNTVADYFSRIVVE